MTRSSAAGEALEALAELRARLRAWPLEEIGTRCYLIPGLVVVGDVTLDEIDLKGADLVRPFDEVVERIRKEILMGDDVKKEDEKKEQPPAAPPLAPTTAELKKLVEAAAAGSAAAQSKLDALVERNGALEKRVETLEAEVKKKQEAAAAPPPPPPRASLNPFDYLGF